MRVTVRETSESERCPYCHDDLGRSRRLVCTRCRAAYHVDCATTCVALHCHGELAPPDAKAATAALASGLGAKALHATLLAGAIVSIAVFAGATLTLAPAFGPLVVAFSAVGIGVLLADRRPPAHATIRAHPRRLAIAVQAPLVEAPVAGGDVPLLLVTRPARWRELDAVAEADPEEVLLAQDDARRLGLHDGDWVVLANEHGDLRGRVKGVARGNQGYVQLPRTRWALLMGPDHRRATVPVTLRRV